MNAATDEQPVPRRVAEIDWERWEPADRATLLFVVDGDEVLLIRKQRGLGAGKINGPGGRLEPGETALDAALRETAEEVCLTVEAASTVHRASLSFQFVDGYRLTAEVFVANRYTGTPTATDEADPFWCRVDTLPFDEMWADDALWLPIVLAGGRCAGWFVFDDDTMLDHRLDVLDTPDGRR